LDHLSEEHVDDESINRSFVINIENPPKILQ
jgi:hypothetical protein